MWRMSWDDGSQKQRITSEFYHKILLLLHLHAVFPGLGLGLNLQTCWESFMEETTCPSQSWKPLILNGVVELWYGLSAEAITVPQSCPCLTVLDYI